MQNQLVTGTQAGFSSSMTLVSGPGPVYTDEVVLVSESGVLVNGTHAATNFLLSTNLPHAGRPFNAATDGLRFRCNGAYTVPSGALQINFACCGVWTDASGGGTVPCADVMPHLEAILAAVQQVKVNAP
jgi:hypothetical protein